MAFPFSFSRLILTQRTLPLFFHHINPRKIPLPSFPNKSMAWTCSKCTFINPDSQKSTCQICLSSPPPFPASSSSSSSPSKPKWSCKACTFLNLYEKSSCEICGTRASASMLSSFEDDELGSSVGNVFLPLQRCNKRKNMEDPIKVSGGFRVSTLANKAVEISGKTLDGSSGFHASKLSDKAVIALGLPSSDSVAEETQSRKDLKTLKILSYNVWFREDLEMHGRMRAIGNLIQLHSPDVICLQEVTPDIYEFFQRSKWWESYKCSLSNDMAVTRPYFCMQLSKLPVKSFSCQPFHYSAMGRELCVAEVVARTDTPLVVATSHLESPCPGPPKWDQMYSKERVAQAKEAVNFLKKHPNVIFCGDMNWDDKLDGPFPIPDEWSDAWTKLRPGEDGWTYDTKSNQMLSGNRKLQKRLDRFLCSLHDFKINRIDMIGMEAIPGLSYIKQKKGGNDLELPVLPSDHYGLLLTIGGL